MNPILFKEVEKDFRYILTKYEDQGLEQFEMAIILRILMDHYFDEDLEEDLQLK